MSLEIRTIRDIDGDADVPGARQIGLQAAPTQPAELEPAPEPWILNKAGFIWGTRRVPCWNCGGSSPRVRGARDTVEVGGVCQGIIPAGTGSTRPILLPG